MSSPSSPRRQVGDFFGVLCWDVFFGGGEMRYSYNTVEYVFGGIVFYGL